MDALTPTTNSPSLEFTDVCVSFSTPSAKRKTIFNKLTLTIRGGDRVALVGQNGSGKTTLLRLLLGAITPESGAVRLSLNQHDPISYVPQDYRNALFPWLSLRTNLLIRSQSLNGTTRSADALKQAAARAMQRYTSIASQFRLAVDLAARPNTLSGGQQQLFLLIKALMDTPKLLILDEPLSAVDFGRKRLIRNFLGQWLAAQRTTLIFATHDFDESVLLADRVIVLGREGGVQQTMPVPLPWPRTPEMQRLPEFIEMVDTIASAVT